MAKVILEFDAIEDQEDIQSSTPLWAPAQQAWRAKS